MPSKIFNPGDVVNYYGGYGIVIDFDIGRDGVTEQIRIFNPNHPKRLDLENATNATAVDLDTLPAQTAEILRSAQFAIKYSEDPDNFRP